MIRRDYSRGVRARLAVVLALACALLAGCDGGGDGSSGRAETTAATPSPAQTLGALVAASHAGDAARIRRLLVAGAKPTASELEEGLGTFAGHRPRTVYRSGRWAVALVQGDRRVEGMREHGAYAAALRRVGGRWRVDLSGRVGLRILGPDPDERVGSVPQAAFELTARSPLVDSGLWIDGAPLEVKGGGSATRGTIYGAPSSPLAPGRHVAVAFGRTADAGTAVAWTFTSA